MIEIPPAAAPGAFPTTGLVNYLPAIACVAIMAASVWRHDFGAVNADVAGQAGAAGEIAPRSAELRTLVGTLPKDPVKQPHTAELQPLRFYSVQKGFGP